MAIKCGNCKEYHDTVADVRWCHKYQEPGKSASKAEKPGLYAPLAEKVVSKKQPVTEGFYKLEDKIVKVVESQQGRLYGKTLELFYEDQIHVSVEPVGDKEGPTKGVWEYAPGIMSKLTVDMMLGVDEAAEFGKLYGICAICGARLTNEESIERGIGPVCFGNMGW